MDTFVVGLWSHLFKFLNKLLLSNLLVGFVGGSLGNKWFFIDCYVLFNVLLSFVFLFTCPLVPWQVSITYMAWACYRIYEMCVYQVNIVIFPPTAINSEGKRKPHEVRDRRRTLLFALHNYMELAAWFAVIYWVQGGHFHVITSPVSALYYSLVTMATLGYGDVTPMDDVGRALVLCQVLVALFWTLVVVARFITFLPEIIDYQGSPAAKADNATQC